MPAITAQQARTGDHPGTLPRPGRGWIPFRTVGGGPQSCALLAVMAAALAGGASFFFFGAPPGDRPPVYPFFLVEGARQGGEGGAHSPPGGVGQFCFRGKNRKGHTLN